MPYLLPALFPPRFLLLPPDFFEANLTEFGKKDWAGTDRPRTDSTGGKWWATEFWCQSDIDCEQSPDQQMITTINTAKWFRKQTAVGDHKACFSDLFRRCYRTIITSTSEVQKSFFFFFFLEPVFVFQSFLHDSNSSHQPCGNQNEWKDVNWSIP